MKKKIKKTKKIIKILFLILVLLLLVFFRVSFIKKKSKSFQATVCTQIIDIKNTDARKIEKILFTEKDDVFQGDLLIKYDSSEIDAKISLLESKIILNKEKLNLLKFREEKSLEDYLNAKKDNEAEVSFINKNLRFLEENQLLYKIQKAKIDILLKDLNNLNLLKQNYFVYSPCNGKISSINSLNKINNKLDDFILRIENTNLSWVELNIHKSRFSKYKIGDSFSINLEKYKDAKFKGKIFEISRFNENFLIIKISINQIKKDPNENDFQLTSGQIAKLIYE